MKKTNLIKKYKIKKNDMNDLVVELAKGLWSEEWDNSCENNGTCEITNLIAKYKINENDFVNLAEELAKELWNVEREQ